MDGPRDNIIKCLALLEALIDFREEDLEEGVYDQGSPFFDTALLLLYNR